MFTVCTYSLSLLCRKSNVRYVTLWASLIVIDLLCMIRLYAVMENTTDTQGDQIFHAVS